MNLPKKLNLVVDMYGCPNRCKHCWLGHMPNLKMEESIDEWLINYFKDDLFEIAYYIFVREPDYCDDYKNRWLQDLRISIHTKPLRFELASFYRLVRDSNYVLFLKEVGVKKVQLTFFGLEEMTDFYVGRKGAYQELLKATDILIENHISVRWQAFINEDNKEEVVKLLDVIDKFDLKKRCPDFEFFVHPGSCDGENRKLYSIRLTNVPDELIPYCLGYEELKTESDWYDLLKDDQNVIHLNFEDELTINISNQLDAYFNFTHMKKEWKIANLKEIDSKVFIEKIKNRDIDILKIADQTSISTLIKLYGNKDSQRLFEKDDYLQYLLNQHMEEMYNG